MVPHSCETVERLFPIWRHNKPASFNHLLNVPHMRGPGSEEFFRRELGYFIQSLEEWSGRNLDPERLREAVRLSNQRRAALRELYGLRQADPPLVSGAEVTRIVVAGMGLPEIVAGIHAAIAGRVVNLVRTLGLQKDIVVTCGGAEDIGLVRAVSEALGLPVQVPEPPRLTAALGAACLAGENQP